MVFNVYLKGTEELAKKFDYLEETISRFIQLYGVDETRKILQAYEKPPLTTIRLNTLKKQPSLIVDRLEGKGFELQQTKLLSEGYIVKKQPFSIGATTEYLLGHYFIQSKASWLPVILLDPKPGEIVIDLTSAPGGKASHIAQMMNNQGTLFCLDISRERMKSLRSNLARCGVINNICIRMDSRETAKLGIKADRVLLDAPCSGEGLMATDKTRRKSRGLDDINRLSALQKELLEVGLKSLKKNGILVYSTCSTAPEENEEVINWGLEQFQIEIMNHEFSNFRGGLINAFDREYNQDLEKAIRLYPHLNSTEGFFCCKIRLQEEIGH